MWGDLYAAEPPHLTLAGLGSMYRLLEARALRLPTQTNPRLETGCPRAEIHWYVSALGYNLQFGWPMSYSTIPIARLQLGDRLQDVLARLSRMRYPDHLTNRG